MASIHQIDEPFVPSKLYSCVQCFTTEPDENGTVISLKVGNEVQCHGIVKQGGENMDTWADIETSTGVQAFFPLKFLIEGKIPEVAENTDSSINDLNVDLDLSFDTLSLFPMISLQRHISEGSQHIYQKVSESNSESVSLSLLLALLAIKSSFNKHCITIEEKNELKNNIMMKTPFPLPLLAKLAPDDRNALTNFRHNVGDILEQSNKLHTVSLVDIAITGVPALVEASTDKEAGATSASPPLSTCCICGDPFPSSEGITCSNQHFVDSGCLTVFVRHINSEREHSSQHFHRRQGKVECPHSDLLAHGRVSQCQSPCYGHGPLLMQLKDPDVIEDYLSGLQLVQSLQLSAEHQLNMLAEIDSIQSAALSARHHGESLGQADGVDGTAAAVSAASEHLAAERKRIELTGFTESLRAMLPDARMCKICSYGPLTHFGCDDLQVHDRGQSHFGGTYSNACPQCGAAPPLHWKSLPLWNGKLSEGFMQNTAGQSQSQSAPLQMKAYDSVTWLEFLTEYVMVPQKMAYELHLKLFAGGLGQGPDHVLQLLLPHPEEARAPLLQQQMAAIGQVDPAAAWLAHRISAALAKFAAVITRVGGTDCRCVRNLRQLNVKLGLIAPRKLQLDDEHFAKFLDAMLTMDGVLAFSAAAKSALFKDESSATCSLSGKARWMLRGSTDGDKKIVVEHCEVCKSKLSEQQLPPFGNNWLCDHPNHVGQNKFSRFDLAYCCATARSCDFGVCVACWRAQSQPQLACGLIAAEVAARPNSNCVFSGLVATVFSGVSPAAASAGVTSDATGASSASVSSEGGKSKASASVSPPQPLLEPAAAFRVPAPQRPEAGAAVAHSSDEDGPPGLVSDESTSSDSEPDIKTPASRRDAWTIKAAPVSFAPAAGPKHVPVIIEDLYYYHTVYSQCFPYAVAVPLRDEGPNFLTTKLDDFSAAVCTPASRIERVFDDEDFIVFDNSDYDACEQGPSRYLTCGDRLCSLQEGVEQGEGSVAHILKMELANVFDRNKKNLEVNIDEDDEPFPADCIKHILHMQDQWCAVLNSSGRLSQNLSAVQTGPSNDELDALARRVGILALGGEVYKELRGEAELYLDRVVARALVCCQSALRPTACCTILAQDVQGALYPEVVFGYGVDSLRHFWSSQVIRVLEQVHPDLTIDILGLCVLNDILTHMLKSILGCCKRKQLARYAESSNAQYYERYLSVSEPDGASRDDTLFVSAVVKIIHHPHSKKSKQTTGVISAVYPNGTYDVEFKDGSKKKVPRKNIAYVKSELTSLMATYNQKFNFNSEWVKANRKDLNEASSTEPVVVPLLKSAIEDLLPGELAKHALSEGDKAIETLTAEMGIQTLGARSKLTFYPELVSRLANRLCDAVLTEESLVHLTAILEYLSG